MPGSGTPCPQGDLSQPCFLWFTLSCTGPRNTDRKVPASRVRTQRYYPGSLLPDDVMASHRKALSLLTWEGRYLDQTAHLGEEERVKPTDTNSGTNQPVRLKTARVNRVSEKKHNCYFYYRWEKFKSKVKRHDLAKMLKVINREWVKWIMMQQKKKKKIPLCIDIERAPRYIVWWKNQGAEQWYGMLPFV